MLESLDKFEDQMKIIRTMIENEDYERMGLWMDKANTLHDIL